MTGGARLLSEDEVRVLLAREEGQFLEFKSMWDQEAETRRALKRPQYEGRVEGERPGMRYLPHAALGRAKE